ncbi:hypothetical protein TNCV_4059551, partial [Trichonephila clavipes]
SDIHRAYGLHSNLRSGNDQWLAVAVLASWMVARLREFREASFTAVALVTGRVKNRRHAVIISRKLEARLLKLINSMNSENVKSIGLVLYPLEMVLEA